MGNIYKALLIPIISFLSFSCKQEKYELIIYENYLMRGNDTIQAKASPIIIQGYEKDSIKHQRFSEVSNYIVDTWLKYGLDSVPDLRGRYSGFCKKININRLNHLIFDIDLNCSDNTIFFNHEMYDNIEDIGRDEFLINTAILLKSDYKYIAGDLSITRASKVMEWGSEETNIFIYDREREIIVRSEQSKSKDFRDEVVQILRIKKILEISKKDFYTLWNRGEQDEYASKITPYYLY